MVKRYLVSLSFEWGFAYVFCLNKRGFAHKLRLLERGFGIYYHLGGKNNTYEDKIFVIKCKVIMSSKEA